MGRTRPRPPGPAGRAANRRGQPASCRLPEEPGKPGRRLLTTSSPAGPVPTHRARGARRRAGPGGAPAGPSGVSRERRRAPPAPSGLRAHPETGAGQGMGAGRSAPPVGLRGLAPDPGAVRPVRESPAAGTFSSRSRPARLALGAPWPQSATLDPGARGPAAGPTPPCAGGSGGRRGSPPPRQPRAPRSKVRAAPRSARARRRPPAFPRRAPHRLSPRLLLCPGEEGSVPEGGFLVAPSHQQHF